MFAAIAVAAALAAAANSYNAQTLVTNSSDSALVNGWGLSIGPTTPWWVSDNGTNKSTLYSGTGTKAALTVDVPGGPTGTVFNGDATAFVVSQGGKSGAARFLFSTEGGQILGWSPTVAATTAIPGADLSSQGAIFKGLTILNGKLYAADFHNGKVDVFDSKYAPVTTTGGFADKTIPKGYGPFGIQALGGNIFVTYAVQDAQKHDDVPKPGKGFVDEFSPDGVLIAHVAKQGGANAPLNAPWGLAMAPAGWGAFGGDLLVGNFGNGRVSAYEQRGSKWVYRGQLRKGDGTLFVQDGLWAIAFGNGAAAGPVTSLYFAAGPNGENAGAFGVITANG
jgi:uncharacterized protein (TIGR03118 family)